MNSTERVLMEIRVVCEDGSVELETVRAATIAEAIAIAENDGEVLYKGGAQSATFVRYINEAN